MSLEDRLRASRLLWMSLMIAFTQWLSRGGSYLAIDLAPCLVLDRWLVQISEVSEDFGSLMKD